MGYSVALRCYPLLPTSSDMYLELTNEERNPILLPGLHFIASSMPLYIKDSVVRTRASEGGILNTVYNVSGGRPCTPYILNYAVRFLTCCSYARHYLTGVMILTPCSTTGALLWASHEFLELDSKGDRGYG